MAARANHQLGSAVRLPTDWDHFPSISRMGKVKTLSGLKVPPELPAHGMGRN